MRKFAVILITVAVVIGTLAMGCGGGAEEEAPPVEQQTDRPLPPDAIPGLE